MHDTTLYLKTQQVADALGIGVSTIKRWVDAGELPASRTVGKHRLISLQEALQFARRSHLSTSGLEQLATARIEALPEIDDRAREALIGYLKEGRGREAKRLIRASYLASGDAPSLADQLICPVMKAIGHGWSVGDWDVFQEHQASQIVASALSGLIADATRYGEAPGPIAFGCSPEGDHYTLATLLGELTLRKLGWDVRNLGPNLPLRSLGRAIELHRPRLVFLAVSHLADPIRFFEQFQELAEKARGPETSLILGGGALLPEMRSRLKPALFGDRMAALAEHGRSLLPAAHPTGPGTAGATGRPASETPSNN